MTTLDRLGATALGGDRTRFVVWAPRADVVEVALDERTEPLERQERGYHTGVIDGVGPGTRYRYRLHLPGEDPLERPDPASRWQPDGLHGPSAVDDPGFAWSDDGWRNPPLDQHVLYELHVGTFTPEGTFDAAADRLADLADLGVTAVELMPVWQFPGERNWGYDGVLPYAVQHSYGGPDGLRRLVDAAHRAGMGVILDVVYNHFGPEGNHLPDFGPYLTDKYETPWGQAVNVDDVGSDEVRRYLIENAVRWVTEFHVDGLRLDAVHAIRDESAVHLLEELATAVHRAADLRGTRVHLIAESDLQDPRLVRPTAVGGLGLDAQWLDDVHHAVHVALTGEQEGYYADYEGLEDLARTLRDRYAYAGRHSAYRGRRIGRPAPDVPYERFVVCSQNHDQVGNRMLGERLRDLVGFEARKVAAATILLSPFTPMLWMGEEHDEPAPFQYFVSHSEPELIEAVRTGRREEFAAFAWKGEAPDPQDEDTFLRSKLDWSLREQGRHATMLALYRALLSERRALAAGPGSSDATPHPLGAQALAWHRAGADGAHVVLVNASTDTVRAELPYPGTWRVALDTADERWDGPGGRSGAEITGAGGLGLDVGPQRVLLLRAG